jgi:MoaA/NifB/PqqE/SkfB family radical SAM enzyme
MARPIEEDRGDALLHEDAAVHAFIDGDAATQARMMAAWGMEPAVALIVLNACENACFFCANPGTIAVPAHEITDWERIQEQLDGRPEGVELLLVGGNEPVLHPHFERALAYAWSVGFRRVQLMTSGQRLTPTTVARWQAWGLAEVAAPIYATQAALHDAVCGVRCHDRLLAGLDAAVAAGLTVQLHTLMLKRTVHDLPALAAMVRERWGAALHIAPVREKAGLFVYDDETLSLAETREVLATLPADVRLLGMPSCLAPERVSGGPAIIRIYFRTQLRAFHPRCAGCARQADCMGVVKAELDRHGGAALRPFSD